MSITAAARPTPITRTLPGASTITLNADAVAHLRALVDSVDQAVAGTGDMAASDDPCLALRRLLHGTALLSDVEALGHEVGEARVAWIPSAHVSPLSVRRLRSEGYLVVEEPGGLALLLPPAVPWRPDLRDPAVARRAALRVLRTCEPNGVIGLSAPAAGPSDLPALLADARDATRLNGDRQAERANERDPVAFAEDRWADVALFRVARTCGDALAAGNPLTRMMNDDPKGGRDLVTTLGAWLRHGRDSVAAAAELHLHPNTVRYRVRRVQELAGVDLEDPRQRLVVELMLLAAT